MGHLTVLGLPRRHFSQAIPLVDGQYSYDWRQFSVP